jgi:hypothetical protein
LDTSGRAPKRQKPLVSRVSPPSTSEHSIPSSRGDAHRDAPKRPLRATESATGALPEALPADPHKALVDALWDRLPHSVRAAVAAMVRAAAK